MSDEDRRNQLRMWANMMLHKFHRVGDHESQRVVELALERLEETTSNESRELCFARYILGQRIDVTGEIRALAEDTIARAKKAKRK